MLAAKDLWSDLPFFGAIGLICGLIQSVGYRYFNKSNVGTELLLEHIPFVSLVTTVGILWFAKWGVERLCIQRDRPRLRALMAHVSMRAVSFASVSAAVIIGFGVAVAACQDYGYAFKFWVLSLPFAALAEIAANPSWAPGYSKLYLLAVGIIIVTPFAAALMR
ncbi:hypothetical protein [Burkholderia sp. F1]|uniref:hypothetical protein n=1 Tax=Burkholderia sp. F1 TaxID=3366817 RepID=UPI003D72387C